MARLPDSFFDDEPEAPVVKVPKGWSVAETDNEDTEDDPQEGDIQDGEGWAEEDQPLDEPENAVPSPVQPVQAPDWQQDWDKDDVPPVVATRAPKKRHAFIEDDFDDEPPVVTTRIAKPKKRQSFVEDFDDEEPVLKPRLTVGAKGEPVVHLDDEDEDTAAPAPLPKRETIIPVKRLSEKALLVSMNVSQWSGRRFDRDVSAEVNASKAATSNAGRFNKMLLPDCAELAEVHRQTSSLRNWFVEKTMPWMNDGARITPSSSYLDFTSEFRRREAEWQKAVDALIAAYPGLKAKAPQQLQSMYNPDDYPTAYELRAKFSMAIRAFPLPDKEDFRVELDPATLAALKDSMADVEGDLARSVVTECYQRLGKAVGAMADRLGDPDAVFRNSLTENLAEAVSALKDLNICGDQKLEDMRRRIERTLTGYTADELRNDMAARKTAAVTAKAAVEDIGRRMAGLMGTP